MWGLVLNNNTSRVPEPSAHEFLNQVQKSSIICNARVQQPSKEIPERSRTFTVRALELHKRILEFARPHQTCTRTEQMNAGEFLKPQSTSYGTELKTFWTLPEPSPREFWRVPELQPHNSSGWTKEDSGSFQNLHNASTETEQKVIPTISRISTSGVLELNKTILESSRTSVTRIPEELWRATEPDWVWSEREKWKSQTHDRLSGNCSGQ